MATITFDTHRFITKLKESGLTESQAVAISEAFKEAHGEAEVATKYDLELMKAELRKDIAETRADLIRWVVGAGFLQTALIAALLIKLIK